MLKPRYYQSAAVASVFQFFRSKEKGNPLIELPTGSGKSIVLGMILQQDYKTMRQFIPGNEIGIYSAGLGSKEILKYTVAGIHSVYNKADEFKHFNLVIIDEAHLIPPSGEGMYQTFLKGIGDHKIIGLTATPYRLGFGKLTDPGHMFNKIVYRADIDTLIEQGYLCKLRSTAANYQMDPTKENVRVSAGDYIVKHLADSFDNTAITNRVCKELVEYKERKHWLVFAIDIVHAEHIAEQLNKNGITACYVHSKMPTHHRDEIISLFKKGVFQCLVNVAVLTTGFDFPAIDLVVLLRPTMSPVLHVQMIGRGSRPSPGKQDCLVLDFAGNLQRLGPINSDFDFKKTTEQGEAPTKLCPACREVVYAGTKTCPCGYVFETEAKATLGLSASEAPVVAQDTTYDVEKVYYHRHRKEGKPDSLKVTYVCATNSFTEWVAIESIRARARAEHWWNFRSGHRCPKTVTEALERKNELKLPRQIQVDESGRWPRIARYAFDFIEGQGQQTEMRLTS